MSRQRFDGDLRTTGFVESHCGRWRITPVYGSCTRPERYELRLDWKVVGSGSTQRECKDDALRVAAQRRDSERAGTPVE